MSITTCMTGICISLMSTAPQQLMFDMDRSTFRMSTDLRTVQSPAGPFLPHFAISIAVAPSSRSIQRRKEVSTRPAPLRAFPMCFDYSHSINDRAGCHALLLPSPSSVSSLLPQTPHLSLLPQSPILSNLQQRFLPSRCFINQLVRTSITLPRHFTTNGSSLPVVKISAH